MIDQMVTERSWPENLSYETHPRTASEPQDLRLDSDGKFRNAFLDRAVAGR
ncbi:hypothetical protein [Arthrobacter sp. NicSoilC12]|uniref:hypothetical protein n=1 Tax=Arthrobacter sp. NicSoilC12 TaxID=2831001 RepID=UPI001CC721F9|nr:hypothetical protein [Arthrobacter sp. NicSoilC12]GIU54352.1 hypothetical protein NicSoilC12_01010 [Arthrobacter sp. NicSoilC12]